ncbi:MAG TPA: Rrf2 family transcriptional regulator [Candidatus Eisenbacteria bacterium]
MKISRRGLYALRALLVLAENAPGEVVTIAAVSAGQAIPQKFLESILVTLKNARLVESVRGAQGGYRLKRAAADITLGEVVRLMDGPLAPLGDAAELRHLAEEDKAHPGLFRVLLDVRDAAAKILDGTTLADLATRNRKLVRQRTTRG